MRMSLGKRQRNKNPIKVEKIKMNEREREKRVKKTKTLMIFSSYLCNNHKLLSLFFFSSFALLFFLYQKISRKLQIFVENIKNSFLLFLLSFILCGSKQKKLRFSLSKRARERNRSGSEILQK